MSARKKKADDGKLCVHCEAQLAARTEVCPECNRYQNPSESPTSPTEVELHAFDAYRVAELREAQRLLDLQIQDNVRQLDAIGMDALVGAGVSEPKLDEWTLRIDAEGRRVVLVKGAE